MYRARRGGNARHRSREACARQGGRSRRRGGRRSESSAVLRDDLPVEGKARIEDGDRTIAGVDGRRHVDGGFTPHERQSLVVRGKTVPRGTVKRGESLQPVERALLLEDMGKAGKRHR